MLLDLLNISRDEIVVDLFAGGGGASLGIEMAGCRVHAAVNHDPMAVAIHRENHPDMAAALVRANYRPVRHDAPLVAMPLLEVCNA